MVKKGFIAGGTRAVVRSLAVEMFEPHRYSNVDNVAVRHRRALAVAAMDDASDLVVDVSSEAREGMTAGTR